MSISHAKQGKNKLLDQRVDNSRLSSQQLPKPTQRMRRLRNSQAMRDLLQENSISTNDLIYPVFVEENLDSPENISSLPGVRRETEKSLVHRAKEISNKNIPAIILFGVSHNKDELGTDSLKPDGLLARMIKTTKDASPKTLVTADICLCEYTDHGHCGPLNKKGQPDNDRTLEIIAKQAVNACEAGADIIAPSGMMDGMVMAIRSALDESGFENIPVLSYAAKFASAHYGPFRDAAGCSLGAYEHAEKNRKSYQMNPANSLEAMREVEIDIQEGADMIMVKPGLPYLDIIKSVKENFQYPTFAYHVSGEYAMLKAAAEKGWLDYEECIMEQMMSFKRAGTDGVLTYAALDIADYLNQI